MDFDLIVIGSGPAGEKGAAQAAYFGRKVALIEAGDFGGAGTNTGTLPSKTLRETSLSLSGLKARNLYGVDLSIRREMTVKDFLFREEQVVQSERERIQQNLNHHKITVLRGFASFLDDHTLQIDGPDGIKKVSGAVILIATGSRPNRPDLFPFEHPSVFDSDEILRIDHMPKKMIVVGGGVIGCEYACTFAALGIEVHLVDGRAVLMEFLDPEISATLKQSMQSLGITFHAPARVLKCQTISDTEVSLILDNQEELRADSVLVAAGRNSNSDRLNLINTGVETGNRGLIKVNDRYQTTVPHIYAAGDVIGFPALASTSMEQARLAMVHAFQLQYKKEAYPILPYGIYTIPEVSMAGESEQTCKEKGIEFVSGKARFSNNSRGTIIGDSQGFLKLIFRKSDLTLLGVHVIGEMASELVHIGLMALMTGARGDLFIKACFNFPTLSETYKYATYDAMGKIGTCNWD